MTEVCVKVIEQIKNEFGIEFSETKNGFARAGLLIQPKHKNFMGIVYGGVLYNLADLTAGIAFLSDGCVGATATGNMQYLRSEKDIKEIICEAHVIKRGKKLDFIEVKITDENGNELCNGQFVYARMSDSKN